jgi:arylesterase/paraoxonase
MTAVMLVLALVFFIGRMLWANGLFSSTQTGFSGSCRVLSNIPGATDIEVAGGMAYVAVANARGPRDADGIYALPLNGTGRLTKLPGTPKDFHPRGLGLYRSPDGSGVFLLAVNRRSGASAAAGATNGKVRFSIDSFEVTNPATTPALVSQGTISSGLLTDPQDVAASGAGSFYVSNGIAIPAFLRPLADWGAVPGSSILHFNGMMFRTVAEDVYGARGLLLTPDGNQLLVASMTTRSLKSFNREMMTGNLTEGGSLTLDIAPENITLDSRGEVWVAGHANLIQWRDFLTDPDHRPSSQVFRVSLANGVPQLAQHVYGNGGGDIAAAGVAASAGKRLLIGSSLDGKLLDCSL